MLVETLGMALNVSGVVTVEDEFDDLFALSCIEASVPSDDDLEDEANDREFMELSEVSWSRVKGGLDGIRS